MNFNILISCMHQHDTSIIQRSNVQSDVVVVNQCDKDSVEEFDFINKKGCKCHAKFINTTERGLSKSRNMAIRNAWGDICQICDDDELLLDDTEEEIIKVYSEHPDAALVAFSIRRDDKEYPKHETRLGYKQVLQSSSVQLTFSRKFQHRHNIWFDEKMGSGTGNGGGEETMFMFTFKRKGLKTYYIPIDIAVLKSGESQWFSGFNQQYFINMGWANRRILGPFFGLLYVIYWPIFRRKCYKLDPNSLSVLQALRYSIKGYFLNR